MPRLITDHSTVNGKAYEYACVLSIQDIVSKYRKIKIVENSSMKIARERFNSIPESERNTMIKSASAGINAILTMEPRIVEDGSDELEISLQSDDAGIAGDVRDVLVIRKSIDWEIGISVKHNHYALKHSRLSMDLDFGKKWFNIPCSQEYFNEIKPYFEELKELRRKNVMWHDIENKDERFYVPILNAFMKELNNKYKEYDSEVTKKMISYLLGINDFYKLIGIDSQRITRIIPFNIYGTLNQSSLSNKPLQEVQILELPTRIVELDFKKDSKTTLELIMDNGWQISFRIHNASSKVEPSLKFDVQLVGQPTALFVIDMPWDNY